MENIKNIALKLGISEDKLFCYGNSMAKVNTSGNKTNSNLILVTAINPTPYGEGKTTISIGLNDALCKLGKSSVLALREPSLGPVFGLKGGACGGGMAKVIPEDEINLHFTGDFHAITSANNLLASAIDNHIYQGNLLNIDPNNIVFKRCLDVNDRSLRDSFNITAASEVMAIFCLANDYSDLRRRLGNILCCYDMDGKPIYCKDLKVDGAMALLLKDAFIPNLVQTLEGNPALVHGGPFANIAHGCNSVVATKLGLSLADYVVTEAGFGSDLGCEKFIDIKCRKSGLSPNFVVLVATVRALEHTGMENLIAHFDNLKQYNVPFCVALNKFSEDNDDKLNGVIEFCSKYGVNCIVTDAYNNGGNGCLDLANYVLANLSNEKCNYLYSDNISIKEKIKAISKNVYHAGSIEFSKEAIDKLDLIDKFNLNHLPICVAKTQYSISDDSNLLGYPKDYKIHVRDIEIKTGSEMIVVLLNKIITMPGLPKVPNYESME